MRANKNTVSSNPMLMKHWDYEKNEIEPQMVLCSESTEQRFWRCDKCGYHWTSSVEARRQCKGLCPCCESGKAIQTGYNDVLTLVPDILDLFESERNPDIDLSKLGVSSKKRVIWHCNECGRVWETELHSRIQCVDGQYSIIKCPHRNTTKRAPEDVPRISDEPTMMRFWSLENTVDPYSTRINSTCTIILLCPDCGYRWNSSPVSFFRNSMHCPACEMRHAVQPGFTDLFTLVPDLERYYDYDKNVGIDATKLGVGSRDIVFWKCPDCGREWQSAVNTRLIKEDGVYRVKQCRTCFLSDPESYTPVSAYPNLVRFWDFERNTADINLTPSHSATEIHWRCKDCGYTWTSSPRDRLRGSGCPCCNTGSKIMSGFNDALTKCPDMLTIYNPSLNEGRDLANTALYSDELFTWRCKICGYTWDASVRNTAQSSCHCPNCLNRRSIPGTNSLADKRPDISCLWSEKNNKSPSDVLCNSYYRATWRCSDCSGEYNAYVVDMVNGTIKCPYCSGERVLPGFNSLAAKYPDLALLWRDEDISSDDILPTSNYRGSWRCPVCAGIYKSSVKDMVAGETHCPYCCGERVLSGFNSFKAKHPDLMDEWDYPCNYALCNPDTVSDSCHTMVWWICSKDRTHSYRMTPYDRLMYQQRNKEPCPFCKGRRRKKRHLV